MAAVSFVRPHLMVMDEPTNNLDLESVAALAECVQRFEGAVVVVSHDQVRILFIHSFVRLFVYSFTRFLKRRNSFPPVSPLFSPYLSSHHYLLHPHPPLSLFLSVSVSVSLPVLCVPDRPPGNGRG